MKQKYPDGKEKLCFVELFCSVWSVRPAEKLCGVLKFTFNFGGTI